MLKSLIAISVIIFGFSSLSYAQDIPECGQQFGFTSNGQSCYSGGRKTSCYYDNNFQRALNKKSKPTRIETTTGLNCGNKYARDCASHVSDFFAWKGGKTQSECDTACKTGNGKAARDIVSSFGGVCLDNQTKKGSDELNLQSVRVSQVSGHYNNGGCRCIVGLVKEASGKKASSVGASAGMGVSTPKKRPARTGSQQ